MASVTYLQPNLLDSDLKEFFIDEHPVPIEMTVEDFQNHIAEMSDEEVKKYTEEVLAKNLSGEVVCIIL